MSGDQTLEHHGVKGMRWGQRKASDESHSSGSHDRRNQNIKRAAVVGGAIAVAAGAAFAAHTLSTGGGKNARAVAKYTDNARRYAEAHATSSPTPKSSPAFHKFVVDSAKGVGSLKDQMKETNRLANIDLKAGYERSNTPLHLRDYLSVDF